MTPDTDDPRDDWLTVDEKLSVHADDSVELEHLRAELAAVRALVDGAVTSCQLGAAVAAHFGRTLPDWDTD